MAVMYSCHLSRRPFGSFAHKTTPQTVRHAARWQPEVIQYAQDAPLARNTAFPAPEHVCTLVTQCSLDRWPRFAQQAGSWGGSVSVAVYIPAPKASTAAGAAVQLLHSYIADYNQQHPQQPFVVSALYANHFAREGASVLKSLGLQDCSHHTTVPTTLSYDQFYPINSLRNLALQQAKTPLIMSLDSDFIISQGLHDTLNTEALLKTIGIDNTVQQQQQQHTLQTQPMQQPQSGLSISQQPVQGTPQQQRQHQEQQLPHHPQRQHKPLDTQQQQQQQPVMLLLPAFQLSLQHDLPDTQSAAAPCTKQQLAAALATGTVEPFHCGVFPPAYQPTDVTRWLEAKEPYAAQYTEYFEPQGIAVKQQLPLYDERFRGYGLNKVQHAWHMNKLGYQFLVLPDAFVVTAPHRRSPSWRPHPGTAHDAAHLRRIEAVYEQFKVELS